MQDNEETCLTHHTMTDINPINQAITTVRMMFHDMKQLMKCALELIAGRLIIAHGVGKGQDDAGNTLAPCVMETDGPRIANASPAREACHMSTSKSIRALASDSES